MKNMALRMQVDQAIVALLVLNDCVVVEGFGSFIANYRPARIHPATQLFLPPSKHVRFNALLTKDDGLLATFLSQKNGYRYADARHDIACFVEETTILFNAGSKVEILDLGMLRRDVEGNIQLEQDETVSLLQDAHGLMPLYGKPNMQRNGNVKDWVGQTASPQRIKPVRTNQFFVKSMAAVISVLVFGGLLTGAFLYNRQSKKVSQANANPIDVLAKTIDEVNHKQTAPLALAAKTNKASKLHDLIPMKTKVSIEPMSDADEISPIKRSHGKFLLIGGAFAKPENAQKAVKQFNKAGFRAAVLVGSSNNLIRVSIGDYATEKQALHARNKLKERLGTGLWVMARR